jgi:hypothetical protein
VAANAQDAGFMWTARFRIVPSGLAAARIIDQDGLDHWYSSSKKIHCRVNGVPDPINKIGGNNGVVFTQVSFDMLFPSFARSWWSFESSTLFFKMVEFITRLKKDVNSSVLFQ